MKTVAALLFAVAFAMATMPSPAVAQTTQRPGGICLLLGSGSGSTLTTLPPVCRPRTR